MPAEKKPYQHEIDMEGFGSSDRSTSGAHQNEHRETASPSAEERNELAPEERSREKQYGPRTHEDTRITSKEGTPDPAEDE